MKSKNNLELEPDKMPESPQKLDNTIEEDQNLVNNLDRLISKAAKTPVELSMHLGPDLFSMTMEQSRIGMLSAFDDASAIGLGSLANGELKETQEIQPFKAVHKDHMI